MNPMNQMNPNKIQWKHLISARPGRPAASCSPPAGRFSWRAPPARGSWTAAPRPASTTRHCGQISSSGRSVQSPHMMWPSGHGRIWGQRVQGRWLVIRGMVEISPILAQEACKHQDLWDSQGIRSHTNFPLIQIICELGTYVC